MERVGQMAVRISLTSEVAGLRAVAHEKVIWIWLWNLHVGLARNGNVT